MIHGRIQLGKISATYAVPSFPICPPIWSKSLRKKNSHDRLAQRARTSGIGPSAPLNHLLYLRIDSYTVQPRRAIAGLGEGGKYRKASAGNTEYSLQQSKDAHKSPAQNKTGHVVENTGSSKDAKRYNRKTTKKKKRRSTRKQKFQVGSQPILRWSDRDPGYKIWMFNWLRKERWRSFWISTLSWSSSVLGERYYPVNSLASHNGVLTSKRLD